MNIAIISYYFNDHHAEGIVTAKLARALAEAGHTISVFGNLVGSQEIVNKSLNNLKCHNYSLSEDGDPSAGTCSSFGVRATYCALTQ